MKKLIAGILLSLCLSANANFVNLGSLSDAINSSEPVKQAAGVGYVAGVFDAYRGIAHCSTMTLTQAVEFSKMQIQANPTRVSDPADVVIVELLMKYWPCPKAGKSV